MIGHHLEDDHHRRSDDLSMGRGDQNEFVIFGELLVLLLFAEHPEKVRM